MFLWIQIRAPLGEVVNMGKYLFLKYRLLWRSKKPHTVNFNQGAWKKTKKVASGSKQMGSEDDGAGPQVLGRRWC